MSEDGGLPDDVTDNALHEAWGKDCPEDRGFMNETCQGCSRFHSCSMDWCHPSDCKCKICLEEAENENI